MSPSNETKPPPEWSTAKGLTPQNENSVPSETPPNSSEHLSPPAKRRREEKERTRVSRACDRCKKKKTRCSGRCPCTLCLRSGLPCEFTASYTRGRLPSVIVDESAMSMNARHKHVLPEQSSTPEQPLESSNMPSLQFPRVFPSPNSDQPILGRVDQLDVPLEQTGRNSSSRNSPEPARVTIDQQGHYIGSSSAASFLLRIQKRLHQNSSLSHDSSIFTFGDAPLPEFDPTFFVLPPKPDAQRLVERYFDYAAPTHRFLHRPTIENLVEEFYETQGDMKSKEDAPAKTALLLIVFAQAQAYMPKGSISKDNSARYFFAAEHQLSKERGAVRLASVQARLLQCFYLLTQSRINHCWSLFGTLSHLALAIGLNRGRKCDPSGTVDYVELESRRRLFWCAYSLDKYLAAALGRPRTFKDEDIDQELPTIVNDSELTPQYINPTPSKSYSVMMAPVEHIKLTRIVSLVLRDLYPIRPPSLTLRMELSAKYTSDLHAWRASLSRFLNDDEGRGIDSHLLIPIYQRQRSVLNLAYYHAMLLIHRPFLNSNFANLTHMPLHSTFKVQIDTSSNISSCLEAAMSIVRVVDDVFKSSNLFRSFWFTQYYAFCAVVVLYIYRIQQHLITPGTCENYFSAGQKCQRQLESVSESDCLARRYCLVLEELRLEAIRQTRGGANGAISSSTSNLVTQPESVQEETQKTTTSALAIPQTEFTPQSDASPSAAPQYFTVSNVPPTPESAVFNSNFLPNSSIMADLTSWGQFDSLVTAGFGMFDGTGFLGDGDLANGIGFGM